MHRGKSFILILIIFFGLAAASLEATIVRVDACQKQYTKDQPVPIIKDPIRGASVVVRGDLVDTATGVMAPPGIDIFIGSRTGGGGTDTSLGLFITPGPNAAVGDHFIKLNYTLELGQPDIFMIRVKEVKINSITKVPAGDVAKGTPVTVTLTGTGLTGVRYITRGMGRVLFSNVQNLTNSNTTYTFKGNAQESYTQSYETFYDSTIAAEGICGSVEAPAAGYRVGQADLTISKAGVYRVLPQPEICAGVARIETPFHFCTDRPDPLPTPTAASSQVEGIRNVGAITYVVTNNSDYLIGQPFKVQLKNGLKAVKSDVIDSLPARGQKTLVFLRPENRRKLMRQISCLTSCYDLDVAPYNWRDPVYTTVADADNQIPESNEGNNNATSD